MKPQVIERGIVIGIAIFLVACSTQVNGQPEPRLTAKGSVTAGRRLIASYGCGTCHSVPGVPGADGTVGPPLDDFYKRSFIAGLLPNTETNLIRWLQDPQQVLPGNAMPNLGLSPAEAQDITAYLYHQPTLGDWISR